MNGCCCPYLIGKIVLLLQHGGRNICAFLDVLLCAPWYHLLYPQACKAQRRSEHKIILSTNANCQEQRLLFLSVENLPLSAYRYQAERRRSWCCQAWGPQQLHLPSTVHCGCSDLVGPRLATGSLLSAATIVGLTSMQARRRPPQPR